MFSGSKFKYNADYGAALLDATRDSLAVRCDEHRPNYTYSLPCSNGLLRSTPEYVRPTAYTRYCVRPDCCGRFHSRDGTLVDAASYEHGARLVPWDGGGGPVQASVWTYLNWRLWAAAAGGLLAVVLAVLAGARVCRRRARRAPPSSAARASARRAAAEDVSATKN